MDKKFPINVDEWTPVEDKNKCCLTMGNTEDNTNEEGKRLERIGKFFNPDSDNKELVCTNLEQGELQVIVIKSSHKCKLFQAACSHAAIRYSNVYVSLYPGEISLFPGKTRLTGAFRSLEKDYDTYVNKPGNSTQRELAHTNNFFLYIQ